MGKSWRKKYLEKHGYEWGQKLDEEINQDYGHNVINPAGTWKNPIYFGMQTFNEYGLCDVYFATRIETGENELVIQGWKTPEEERQTVPIFIERDGTKAFTGIYRILGEMEVKRSIPTNNLPHQNIFEMMQELNDATLSAEERLVELVKKINYTK